MDYEIIATLGPASRTSDLWQAMLSAGATAFRLNTAHLTLAQLHDWLDQLQAFLASQDTPPPLVLDLQGSKWRLGQFAPFELTEGQSVTLLHASTTPQPGVLPVPHPDFFAAAVHASGSIVLNDAKIRLTLESVQLNTLQARVLQGGPITPNKGITFTASEHRIESLHQKDQAILASTQSLPFVRYAISYVRDAAEVDHYRSLLGPTAYLIAKIERQPAVDEASQMRAADALWLCRGDLGAELGMPGMAAATHRFSGRVPSLPIPAIMAGQVLEHMTTQPTPTRSEVCYLYDTLTRGYGGFVLSDETAIGLHPVESCQAAALFREPIK